jgi:hypothetical protein
MHIVVVEDDHVERDWARQNIMEHFSEVDISLVRNVGEFLLRAEEFRGADIVVMEHYLPLGQNGSSEEETEAWFANLRTRFPDMTMCWDHQKAGERLARWMRRNGMRMPILFYTYSGARSIARDVRYGVKVFHLQKVSGAKNLGPTIDRLILQKPSV